MIQNASKGKTRLNRRSKIKEKGRRNGKAFPKEAWSVIEITRRDGI
jgi:hypothetical protein